MHSMENKMQRKNILITNDDGVDSPGLMALATELEKIGKVTVLAPDHNWSASGHVRTLERPLRVKETCLVNGMPAFAADGSPADCVALGLRGFLDHKPDLIVSGINTSANLGEDVSYSGTVAAAMEAVIWGLPAVAVSLDSPAGRRSARDYTPAAYHAGLVAKKIFQNGLKAGTLLNVNIPALPLDQILGIRATRLGKRIYHDHVEKRIDPRGNSYYWIAGKVPDGCPDAGSDIAAITQGFISVTPIHLDMTAYFQLTEIAQWDWGEGAETKLPERALILPELNIFS